tara:strand:+ start:632 stop:844 length:213 start_codon:yes stop_codon:yes gene_type:complete
MNEDDLKAIVAKYQQKSFEFFNQNIVFEVQIERLSKKVAELEKELLKLSSAQESFGAETSTPKKRSTRGS